MSDFPKQYDPKTSEAQAQLLWEEHHTSSPKASTTGKTFYIPIPPPNVTGKLHIGHSLMLTLEDIMIRYHRMHGDDTVWIPGTDHAGISTQARVEDRLNKRGTPRRQIGREAFLEACKEWVTEYGGHIQGQIAKMWASVDWSKERYTFDEKSNKLVEDIFIDLYNKWLIYRGEYMVNYSPALESVISDIEVEHEEVVEKMYYINYFVSGSDKELLVATTRPETLLGDQAVAVHPKDKRYKKLIGKSVILPIVNKEIPIIADEMVDMEFGTWVVKITPAHDPADFETAKRHGLRTDYRVIEPSGIMSREAGTFAWQRAIGEARDNIVELLKSKWNLVKVEPYRHKVGFCERSKCRIESVVSTQWFVRASKMAEKVITWYKNKEFEIMPERFNKTFEDWIFNLRDWCISRQLWWWHQIPAYYLKDTHELIGVTKDPAPLYEKYGKENVIRDDDVLDTWFSSALWPFSILDWNFENPGELFEKYYPANVIETGHDILFFWVIRMFLMGYEYTGQTPFKTVYLHGLVLNEDGKKMSKSAGTVIDPLSVIENYSADSLRLALVLWNTPGNNLNFSMRNVEEYSLFLNKFWNIIRFTWMNIGTITESREAILGKIEKNTKDLLPYESWILSRLTYIREHVSHSMEDLTFTTSGSELISFIRDEFADLAIEAYKIEKDRSTLWKEVMSLLALDILAMMHPYIPHITETLYNYLTWGKVLAWASWPETGDLRNEEKEEELSKVFDIVRVIRNIRAESGIKPGEFRDVSVLGSKKEHHILEDNKELIIGLAKVAVLNLEEKPEKSRHFAYGVTSGFDVYVDAAIDESKLEEEKNRLREQIEDKKSYLRAIEQKLSNGSFAKNAPEKVVRAELEKKNLAREQLEKLEEKLKTLSGE